MKRSIQNKLVSAIAFSALILCYTSNIALAWRIQIGPINDEMAIIINCIHQSIVMFGSMNLSEIMIYKVKNSFTKHLRILISQNVLRLIVWMKNLFPKTCESWCHLNLCINDSLHRSLLFDPWIHHINWWWGF